MSPARQDLLAALTLVQNHRVYAHQDILTITGFGMTDDEVRAHLEACIRGISNIQLCEVRA